ncbi:hypothetical protein MMC07_008422, partial [Pseudocyphellaria aurata]|nr:hypothetical protein [Pseudocyphellaria aurata]
MPGSFDQEYEETTVLHQAIAPSQSLHAKGKSLAATRSTGKLDAVAAKMDKMTLGRRLDLSIHLIQESLGLPALHCFTNFTQFRSAVNGNDGLRLYKAIANIVSYAVTTNDKVMEEHTKLSDDNRVQEREIHNLRRELRRANQKLEDHLQENSAAQNQYQNELQQLNIQLDVANDQL